MRSIKKYLLSILTLLALPAPLAAEEPLPATHPIYAVPRVLENRVESIGVARRLYSGGPPKLLAWKIALDREKFMLGEPVTGLLTVTNPPENEREQRSFRYELSPPANGSIVSTLGIWNSRQQANGSWPELAEIFEPNHGCERARAGFQGQPLVLRPGESRTFPLLLNTMCNNWGHWYAGPGFTEPGRYRVYLRHHNFDARFPFELRHQEQDDRARREQDASDRVELLSPQEATILGPYDVEVVAPPPAIREPLQAVLQQWMSEYRSTDNWSDDYAEPFNHLRKHSSLGDPSLSGVRRSTEFSRLRFLYTDYVQGETNNERRERKQTVANSTDKLLKAELPIAMHEAVLLLHCLALHEAGQTQRALDKALAAIQKSEVVLPDLQVFVAEREYEAKQKKKGTIKPGS
jgi:hypothetical protein